MKHYEITPRNWFLIQGKPRPVTGLRKQYVYAQDSAEHSNELKFPCESVEPLTISEDLIVNSNLRSLHQEDPDSFDSLKLKTETIDLPFIIRFHYEQDSPCEIIFHQGDIIRLKYIHSLQQFIQAVTGKEMRIRMKF